MTVRELVSQLLKEDQYKEVVVAGYEGGFDLVKSVECLDVIDHPEPAWYYGAYEQVYDKDTKPQKKVIYLAS
jgi:hypothetical protein